MIHITKLHYNFCVSPLLFIEIKGLNDYLQLSAFAAAMFQSSNVNHMRKKPKYNFWRRPFLGP